MKKCKLLCINIFHSPSGISPNEHIENEINRYLSKGYEIKAVQANDNWWYIFLEKNI
jgi:adenosine deaminase